MVPNGAEWCQMVPNGAEWCRMVANAEWCRMVSNGVEWCRMVPNSAEWCRMVPHGAEWSQMEPNEAELSQMVQNGAKWYALFKLMILSNPSKGGICRHSSNHSHGITKIGNKLVKGKMFLDDESLTVTARKFVEHLKEVKCKCGVKSYP